MEKTLTLKMQFQAWMIDRLDIESVIIYASFPSLFFASVQLIHHN